MFMEETDQGHVLLSLLIQHEEAIGSLYKAFALRFPDLAEFWQGLVVEEKAHAEVLAELSIHLKTQKVFLNKRKFNVTGVQTAINYVNKQSQSTGSGTLNILQAMSTALDIERAIIDREFFEVFESDLPSIKREFEDLREHTAEHINRIADKFAELRK